MNIAILLKSIIALVSALAGVLLLFNIKVDHRKLCALISFSAGALFSAAVFTLIPESFGSASIIEVIISVMSGYFLFFFISKYYSHVCPACAASHFDEQTTKRFSEIVLALITALSFHSFLDGMALSTEQGNFATSAVFAAITAHKFPEGLALAALMLSANYKKPKILLYVFLVESVTVLGAVSGTLVFSSLISPVIMGMLTAHIAGGFIYLAIHAILGEMYKHHKGLVSGSFAVGIALIYTVHIYFH